MTGNETKTTEEFDNDEIIEFDPDAGLHRVYDFLPYSHWRIKQILNDYCNMHIKCVRAYKEGRYPGYKQRYNVYDNETGELIRKDIHLDEFRRIFAGWDIPLHKGSESIPPKSSPR